VRFLMILGYYYLCIFGVFEWFFMIWGIVWNERFSQRDYEIGFIRLSNTSKWEKPEMEF
jgi:hypothetical protein